MIRHFNSVSNWVASSIVLATTVRSRAKAIISLTKMAQYLLTLNNLHLVTAFISGMNSSSITRLKWTLKKVPKRYNQILSGLESLISMQGAFKNYRNLIQQLKPPSIPYLGVCLQDLTFVDENPDRVGQLINCTKLQLVHSIIKDNIRFQDTVYDIAPMEDIQEFIEQLPHLNEKELYQCSLEREPRNAERRDII